MATLLAFVRSPVVGALHRWGVGRVLAVVLVGALVMAALGGAGWALSGQVGALAEDLPRHTETVKRRIAEWRPGRGGVLDRARRAVDEVVGELEKVERPPKRTGQAPMPVIIRGESRPLLQRVPKLARDILEQVAGTAEACAGAPAPRLLASPARDEVDAAALKILGWVLGSTVCAVEVLPAGQLSADVVDTTARRWWRSPRCPPAGWPRPGIC